MSHHRTRGHATLFVATTLLAAAGSLHAASPIDQTRPLDPRGRIEIENLKGSIEVRAWDRPEVRVQGSLGAGVEKLEIEGDGKRLMVKVRYPGRSGFGLFSSNDRTEPTHLVLTVPLRADLDIDSVSARVVVDGVASGELSIDSVSGDVTVAAAPGEANVDSVSGDLRLTINSDQVDAESVSGDIELRGRLGGDVSIESVSGGIDIAVQPGSSLRKLTGSSVSGDMRVATALAGTGRIALDTVSGDIRLRLPRNLSATVTGESFSGELSAPGANVVRPKHGPGSSLEHRYGGGSAEVRIETFSGDASLQLE